MIEFKYEVVGGKFKDKLCGIYRIDFDNGFFYIGSSTHLRQRWHSWKRAISNTEAGKNVDVRRMWGSVAIKIKGCKVVSFSVVKYCKPDEVKLHEEAVMCGFRGDSFMINKILHPSNGIIVRSKDGVEVTRYTSLMEAARKLKLFTRRIQDVCDGYRKTCHNMIFEYENKSLRVAPKPRQKKHKPIRILKFTIDGQFVKGYLTTAEAARDCKINKKGIYSVIVGKQRTAAGFVFKRA